MTTQDCFLVFSPFLALCALGALIDLGRRVHGGLDTPTPVADAIEVLAGHAAQAIASVLTRARSVGAR